MAAALTAALTSAMGGDHLGGALPEGAAKNGASTASGGLVSTVMLGATVATQLLVRW